jgi:uncharacterized protein (TIGR02302 family)
MRQDAQQDDANHHGDDARRPENPAERRSLRLAAWTAAFWERFWPLAVPPFCILLLFATVSWLGVWNAVPDPVRYIAIAFFAVAFAYSALGLRHLNLPVRADVSRRIERASGLEHQPITAIEDEIALGNSDPLGRALWVEHRKRMAGNLANLTGGAPRPDANKVDPWALRAMLVVAAFAALGFSFGPQGGNIGDAWSPDRPQEQISTRLDAWINPPAYTKRPPVYLSAELQAAAGPISVPQGSEFFLRFVGDGDISVEFSDGEKTVAVEAAPAADAQVADTRAPAVAVIPAGAGREYKAVVENSGTFQVLQNGRPVSAWQIDAIADKVPEIRMTSLPSAALSGSLQLDYEASDDYGIVSARAEIEPAEAQNPDARPLVEAPELPLSLPRNRATKVKAKVNRDLTQHPWAGSEVVITLAATDDAEQTGTSEPARIVLPGRNFSEPLALALIEQRRMLALDANQQKRVAELLDATMIAPEEFIRQPGIYIAMKAAWRRIASARDDETLRSSLDLLWEIALAVEFGDMSQAERKLREAQEKLSEALERGASDEEIQKLMEELRQAMNEFLEQMVREAMQNPSQQNPLQQNPMTQTLRQRDLERMLDQIENLARSGSKDAAREMLSELQRMMENLRAGRQMQQRQTGNSELNQALDELSQLMRRQQELMDETFRMQQGNPQDGEQQDGNEQQGGEQQDGEQQGGQNPMTPEELAEALKNLQEQQDALQKQLGELGEKLEGLGLDPSQQFGEAGREMGEAGKNLGQGRPGDATGDQGQALEALRRGVQQMMQQMAGGNQGQDSQQRGEGQAGQDRNRQDPLGRSERADGLQDNDDTKVPGEIEAQRAREIMEAIRNRLARPDGPLMEKRYLERLLETD